MQSHEHLLFALDLIDSAMARPARTAPMPQYETIDWVCDYGNRWTIGYEVTAKYNPASRDEPAEFEDFEVKYAQLGAHQFKPGELGAHFIESCEGVVEQLLFDRRHNGEFE